MEVVFGHRLLEINMKEIGIMVGQTEKAFNIGKMEINTMEHFKMV